MKKSLLIILCVIIGGLLTFVVLVKFKIIPNPTERTNPTEHSDFDPNGFFIVKKPVIYLYPTQKQQITISLEFPGKIFVSYPKYNNGWSVTAYPDGTIINEDGKKYSYLFWEGIEDHPYKYNFNEGFIVKGSDASQFLQEKLEEIGLTPNEYNEFIVYWLPYMINNKYNLIHFATYEEYAKRIPLDIVPKPDSELRVFMVFQGLEEYKEVKPQYFQPFRRNGFTVIEWGGTQIP